MIFYSFLVYLEFLKIQITKKGRLYQCVWELVVFVLNCSRTSWTNVLNIWCNFLLGFMQDPDEPALLFTKPLDPEKLAAAGIVPPSDSSTQEAESRRGSSFRGRMGRGGRIVFDRWNALAQTPLDSDEPSYVSPPKPRQTVEP